MAVWQVGTGESQVLGWALRGPGKVAILDDRAARRCATLLGIPVIGTVGVVALAKRRGLVSAAAPIFTALEEAGLFLSKALIREVLADLGPDGGTSGPGRHHAQSDAASREADGDAWAGGDGEHRKFKLRPTGQSPRRSRRKVAPKKAPR